MNNHEAVANLNDLLVALRLAGYGNDYATESVERLLDRLTGWCPPHAKIDLDRRSS